MTKKILSLGLALCLLFCLAISAGATTDGRVGAMKGWYWDNGSWYYYIDGERHIGWLQDNGAWYYLAEPYGQMHTGWLPTGDGKYYFGESGAMVTGDVYIDPYICTFDANGKYLYKDNFLEYNKAIVSQYPSDSGTLAYYLYAQGADRIQSADPEITALAAQIVAGASTDYAKLAAIYVWVAQNIYYDMPTVYTGASGTNDALLTLQSRKAVCAGYARLTAALCRAVGIPCKYVLGYAHGAAGAEHRQVLLTANRFYLETGDISAMTNTVAQYYNHAWNEAYVDGQWITLDTSWGSGNRYNGPGANEWVYGAHNEDYFNPDLDSFSDEHALCPE